MLKLLLFCAFCAFTLSACEKQKKASAEVGAIPKQMMDNATNDLNNAQALEAEKRKALENVYAQTDEGNKKTWSSALNTN